MSNIQYALGEGHMTRHDEHLRMDYGNTTCLMECVKPNLVKVQNGFSTMPIVYCLGYYNSYWLLLLLLLLATIFRWCVKDVCSLI